MLTPQRLIPTLFFLLLSASLFAADAANTNADSAEGDWSGVIVWILSFSIILLICIILRLSINIRSNYDEKKSSGRHTRQLIDKISELENEIENLKSAIADEPINDNVREIVKSRIHTLNEIVCGHIAGKNDNELNLIVDKLIDDRASFMENTMLALKAEYPGFIEYLVSKNLTEYEIQYVSLYAIGMNGKSVGKYIRNCQPYRTSSDIRKKLGLTEHDTNLAIHIRKIIQNSPRIAGRQA